MNTKQENIRKAKELWDRKQERKRKIALRIRANAVERTPEERTERKAKQKARIEQLKQEGKYWH